MVTFSWIAKNDDICIYFDRPDSNAADNVYKHGLSPAFLDSYPTVSSIILFHVIP